MSGCQFLCLDNGVHYTSQFTACESAKKIVYFCYGKRKLAAGDVLIYAVSADYRFMLGYGYNRHSYHFFRGGYGKVTQPPPYLP